MVPAGTSPRSAAGQLGLKVLLIEKDELGGECLNRGCIPSKALIHASLLYSAVRTEGADIGVRATDVTFDLPQTIRWKDAVVAKERGGVASLLKSAGVNVLKGEARFTGPRSVDFAAPDGGHERIDFEQAIIATGAVPMVLKGFEPDGQTVITASDILQMTTLPHSLLVLGGGVSGCELGEFLARRRGRGHDRRAPPPAPSRPRAGPRRAELTGSLERAGVKVRVGTKAVGLERTADGVALSVESSTGKEVLRAERLFVTIGKRPASRDLGLDEAGVSADPKTGFIAVDDQMRTNVPHIYAVGDVARPPMLAHKAYREGMVAAEAIAGRPDPVPVRGDALRRVHHPGARDRGPHARRGRKARPSPVREVRFPYAALGRAHANHATGGWAQGRRRFDSAACSSGSTRPARAVGEFIAEAALAIEMGATVRDLASTIHPHPDVLRDPPGGGAPLARASRCTSPGGAPMLAGR